MLPDQFHYCVQKGSFMQAMLVTRWEYKKMNRMKKQYSTT
jgi:hypothetical protein